MSRPTPYPDVNEMVALLLDGARAVLGNDLIGMYLYGSLAAGGFDPDSSDIDFVAVTAHPLDEATFQALSDVHARIAAKGSRWAHDIEGYYLPFAQARRYDPAAPPVARIERGRDASFLYWTHQHWDGVIQRHQLRECGIRLHGPEARELVDPVTPEELRAAVAGNLPEIAAWLAASPDDLRSDGLHNYVVLTQCRILYTLRTGRVVSKPQAAAWAAETLPECFSSLASKAAAGAVRWEDRDETLALVHMALAESEGSRNVTTPNPAL